MKRTFEVKAGYNSTFTVTTTSPRRFLVVNTLGRYIEKRTDSFETARRFAAKDIARGHRVIVDTTGFLQPCTGWLDVGKATERECRELSANRCEWCKEPRCSKHLEGGHCPYPRHA